MLVLCIKRWHKEPSAEFDELRLGDYFEAFFQGQTRELGLTEDDLHAFRPSASPFGAKKAPTKGAAT